MDVPCEDIIAVKKEKRLGFEGLEVTAKDGQVGAPDLMGCIAG